MKMVSVAAFKSNFDRLLDEVRQGEQIAIQYGRRKEIVAILTPPPRPAAEAVRRLGVLSRKARFKIRPDFKMTEADLIGS
jgi:antitoxin (DNA-binding transcriptional repressor) of toxin-antitoxin stability system